MGAGADARAREVLDFWFGAPGTPGHGEARAEWFRKDPAFDAAIRDRFGALHEEAARGGLGGWEAAPGPMLALVIVLDQFSRNLFRGDRRAFAQDARALACARAALARGDDRLRLPVERQFLYLPFEHSEDPADQDLCVELMRSLEAFAPTRGLTAWAEKHRDLIRRFGRFPHRNAALGRDSTPEELDYLARPGAGF